MSQNPEGPAAPTAEASKPTKDILQGIKSARDQFDQVSKLPAAQRGQVGAVLIGTVLDGVVELHKRGDITRDERVRTTLQREVFNKPAYRAFTEGLVSRIETMASDRNPQARQAVPSLLELLSLLGINQTTYPDLIQAVDRAASEQVGGQNQPAGQGAPAEQGGTTSQGQAVGSNQEDGNRVVAGGEGGGDGGGRGGRNTETGGLESRDDERRRREITALIEKTEQKEADPQYWMDELDRLHALPKEERETDENKEKYFTACITLKVFAHGGKLSEGRDSKEMIVLQEQLKSFEKEEIETGDRTKEEKEDLQDLLDDLERHQNTLFGYQNTLDTRKKAPPEFFSKKQWDDMQKKADKLQEEINSLEVDIKSRTRPDFLAKREELKKNINTAKERIGNEQDNEQLEESSKQKGEVADWVKNLEEQLLAEEKPDLKESPDDLPSFSKVLDYFNKEQQKKDSGDPDFWLERYNWDWAKKALSWYFHEAREQGALNDGLENTLDKKYQEWAADLMSHREINPHDGSVRIIQKTFPQIQDELIEYLDNLLDPAKPQYVEHNSKWSFLQRHGVSGAAKTRLQGVRTELVRRAMIQMEDSLLNLSQQLDPLIRQTFSYTQIEGRFSGEWNVYKLEKKIREDRESQEIAERSRPLFRHESYYSIDLLGRNLEEIERGVDQAADYIIRSAITFSLEAVRQSMELLTRAIEKKVGIIDTRTALEIQRKATNKIDFFVLDWLGSYLMMDQFASYYSDRMRMDGDQKLKRVPAMHDGQAGLTIHWLTSPLYELYHRPQGFKGQLYDDDQTHKKIRGLKKEQLIRTLMKYELKDDKSRSKLIYGPTIHDYLQLFDRKGIIPVGIIPEDKVTPNASDEKNPTEFFEGLTSKERLQLFTDLTVEQRLQLFSLFYQLTPDERVDIRQWKYNQVLQVAQAKDKDKDKSLTLADLAQVREAAIRLANEKHYYQTVRSRAESAFDTANKVLDIFGESAFLGAPSIIMENGPEVKGPEGQVIKRGDFISTNDYVLVQKYAILQATKNLTTLTSADGKKYQVDDNLAMIRYRSQEWRKRWWKAGLDRSKTPREFVISFLDDENEKNGIELKHESAKTGLTEEEWQAFKSVYRKFRDKNSLVEIGSVNKEHFLRVELTESEYSVFEKARRGLKDRGFQVEKIVKLAEGFEETGLTEAEWQAFTDTDKKLKKKGYLTEINGVKFDDIVSMDDLQPVLNNFLADYKSSESELNNPYVIEEVARGKMTSIANIRKRLGFTGRQRLEGTTQQEIDEYTQRIEDSRSFDAELERLAYFAATHNINEEPMMWERGRPIYQVSANRVDYGYQRQSWGVKRLYHLKAFWYTNLRRTIPRAADLIHAVPITLTSLSREHAFDNFLQMCWDINKMESIDNPGLVMMGDRHKDQAYIRGRGEGSLSEGQGGLDKLWGFWEKPWIDANALWKRVVGIMPNVGTRTGLESILQDPGNIADAQAEELVDAVMEALGRVKPLLIATEKSLGEDRQALSAGTGYDENDKFLLRFFEWALSQKTGDGREQGGLVVQKEIAEIIELISLPGTFAPGRVYIIDERTGKPKLDKGKPVIDLTRSPSIWEEVVRKLTPSHNPRIIRVPNLTYTLVV